MNRGCAILDFGNVVATFDHAKACRRLSQLATPPVDERVVATKVFESGIEASFDRGQLSSSTFISKLRAELGIRVSDAEIAEAWSDIFADNRLIYPTIRRIKRAGCTLILASNTNELHYEKISNQFAEILDLFDERVLSFRIGVTKPHPSFFAACLALCQSAHRCVYLDDRVDFVEAARSHGMTALAYAGGPAPEVLQALGIVEA